MAMTRRQAMLWGQLTFLSGAAVARFIPVPFWALALVGVWAVLLAHLTDRQDEENALLRDEFWRQFGEAHAEMCGRPEWPHEGKCYWPPPPELVGGQG